MVKFQTINLVKDLFSQQNSELRDMDLILCRNVFIYFENSVIAKILDKFYHALQPLGYLITGHAELYSQNLSQFQAQVFPESIVYQRQADNLVDSSLLSLSSDPNPNSVENLSVAVNYSALESAFQNNNIQMQKTALNLLKQLPPNTQIQRLGNQTAAELILQLETALKIINL